MTSLKLLSKKLGFLFVLFFNPFCIGGNSLIEFGANNGANAITAAERHTSLDKVLESFYRPCPFPCRNFTEAFFAEANPVWFRVESVFVLSPNATGEQLAIRLEITRFCRLDVSGNFNSDHILVSGEELEYILKPEVGKQYVAAVIPRELHSSSNGYRLVTPLVPVDGRYPWKHLCRSCFFNNSTPRVLLDTYENDQIHACSCGNYGDDEELKTCKHVTVGNSAVVGVSDEYHQHAVLMTIIIVGVTVCTLFLLIGLGYWRYLKYKEHRRIQRSVVPRLRGCQLDHPGPEVTGSPPPVPLTNSQLPIRVSLLQQRNNDFVIHEDPQYRQETNNEVRMLNLEDHFPRQTSVTPLLATNNSPPDSPSILDERL